MWKRTVEGYDLKVLRGVHLHWSASFVANLRRTKRYRLRSRQVGQTVPMPAGGVGYISHEFNRGEVEDYVEVMVRRQNKGYTR